MAIASTHPATRWTTRIIPIVLAGCVGLATYVVVKRVCVDFFHRSQHRPRVTIAFLVPYFIFLVLMVTTYIRLFTVVACNPDVVPLGPKALKERRQERRRAQRSRSHPGDLEGQPYVPEPDPDPDSPGLEIFYSKDVFICETDGRPRWCSSCANWKPDRTYHNSEINRCVRKLDHYCPWVGGIVSQSSYKFFVQFTFYTTLYCAVVLAATATCLKDMVRDGMSVDGFVVAIVAIGGFFGLFTFMMTMTGGRYIFMNLTNVEVIKQRATVHQLAIRVPSSTPSSMSYGLITYPLPRPSDTSSSHLSGQTIVAESPSPRDLLATRTFAILRTAVGQNPWDLGLYRNWKAVMGSNIWDWFLPIRRSPCASFEGNISFYEMGPLYHQLRSSYGFPDMAEATAMKQVMEMQDIGEQ